MAYRTLVLYIGFDVIEAWIFSTPEQCFYKSLRRNNDCIRDFDFSDHIVLFLTHFVLVPWIEMSAVRAEGVHRSKRHHFWLNLWYLALLCITTYFMFYTALSFHYFGENLVAWGVVLVCVFYPWFLLEPRFRSAIHAP